jgi:hypothetical protein
MFSSLHNISREHGSGAQERKRAIIARLLVAAKGVRMYTVQSCHINSISLALNCIVRAVYWHWLTDVFPMLSIPGYIGRDEVRGANT